MSAGGEGWGHRCRLEPVRMAIVKKPRNNTYWRGCGEKGILLHGWWECRLIQLLWRTVWRLLKKPGIKLPYEPPTPPLGLYLEKRTIQKDTCTPVLSAALFTIARTRKQSDVHRQMRGQRSCGTYTQWCITQP